MNITIVYILEWIDCKVYDRYVVAIECFFVFFLPVCCNLARSAWSGALPYFITLLACGQGVAVMGVEIYWCNFHPGPLISLYVKF